MVWLNSALAGLLNALLFPFRSFPPLIGLAALALLTALAMHLVFRATSNRPAMRTAERRIAASVFEIRLFNDDPRAILRAQVHILRQSMTYLRLSLRPLAWTIVPLALLLAHLHFYYGYGGLTPGQPAIVKARLKSASPTTPAVVLDAPDGVHIETPVLWIPSEREAAWRVVADRAGDYQLHVTMNGHAVSKTVHVSDHVGWRSPARWERSFVKQVLYPTEPPIDNEVPLETVSVSYPERRISVLGWDLHWSIAFLTLSLVFAFALKIVTPD